MKKIYSTLVFTMTMLSLTHLSHAQVCSPAINQQANPQITNANPNLNMSVGQTGSAQFRFANTGDPDVVPANTLEMIISIPDTTNMIFQSPYLAAGSGCGIWTVDMSRTDGDTIVLRNTSGTTLDGDACDIQFRVKPKTLNVQVTYTVVVNRTNTTCVGDADPSAANNTKSGFLNATVPLPVHFSSFTARQQGCTALLNWTTEMEYNNDHFAVERSNDGKAFSEIGRVATAGNSKSQQRYSYSDLNPAPGINQYRITQVDRDGISLSTSVQTLKFDCGNTNIKVYPSVTDGLLFVDLPVGYENANISLYSSVGQLINLPNTGKTNHSGLHTLQLKGIAQGSYLLRVVNGTDVKTFKVIYQ